MSILIANVNTTNINNESVVFVFADGERCVVFRPSDDNSTELLSRNTFRAEIRRRQGSGLPTSETLTVETPVMDVYQR